MSRIKQILISAITLGFLGGNRVESYEDVIPQAEPSPNKHKRKFPVRNKKRRYKSNNPHYAKCPTIDLTYRHLNK